MTKMTPFEQLMDYIPTIIGIEYTEYVSDEEYLAHIIERWNTLLNDGSPVRIRFSPETKEDSASVTMEYISVDFPEIYEMPTTHEDGVLFQIPKFELTRDEAISMVKLIEVCIEQHKTKE